MFISLRILSLADFLLLKHPFTQIKFYIQLPKFIRVLSKMTEYPSLWMMTPVSSFIINGVILTSLQLLKNCQSVSGLHLIVLTKLCLDAGNDFSIILCNFGGLLVGKGGEGVKVIEEGLRSIPPNPGSKGQKEPARNRGLNEFAFLFLTLKTNIYDNRLSYDVSQPFAINRY